MQIVPNFYTELLIDDYTNFDLPSIESTINHFHFETQHMDNGDTLLTIISNSLYSLETLLSNFFDLSLDSNKFTIIPILQN